MEWLLKIVDLLKTEKKEGIDVIHLNDLKEWLDIRGQEVITNSNLNDELRNFVSQLKDKRWLLECQLDEWQKKVIYSNPNKDEINLFFQATRKLLEIVSFTEPVNLDNVLELTSVLEPKLEKLIKSAEDSKFAADFKFLITKEEADDVIINPFLKELLELDGGMKLFEQKIVQSGYRKIETLAKKLSLIGNYMLQIKQVGEDLKNNQEKLTVAEDNKKDKEVQLQQIKEDPYYISQEMVIKERENIQKQIEDNKDAIFTFFSNLKPLFLEYKEFGFKRSLIDSYLENSVEAFLTDENLLIKHAFEHMKIILNSGKFSMSFKDANSILDVLEKGEHQLEEMQKKHFKLVKELEDFEKPLQNNDFFLKVEDAAYRLEHFSKQVDKLEEKLSFLEEKAIEMKDRRDREIELFQNLVRVGIGKNISVNF